MAKSGFDVLSEDLGIVKKDVHVLKQDVGMLKQDVGTLKQDVGVLKQDVGVLKQEVKRINGVIPTKDYIDDKMADLGAEIGKRINRAREEEHLFAVKLLEFLKIGKVLKKEQVEHFGETAGLEIKK